MSSVQPEKILKELSGLWSGMSKDDTQGVNSAVNLLRFLSCKLNVIVSKLKKP